MPTETRILLIRHGQSRGNAEGRFGGHLPTPLSALGVRQAEATAQALAKERISAIYASDLLRAVQTAEPLARLTNLEIVTTDAFRERNVGILEGLTFEEAADAHPEEYAALLRRDFEHVMPSGESYRQLLDRSSNALDRILKQYAGGTVAIFSHTGTIGILTLHILGALDAPHLRPVWIATSNCGIARFRLREDGYIRLLAINDTRHLVGSEF